MAQFAALTAAFLYLSSLFASNKWTRATPAKPLSNCRPPSLKSSTAHWRDVSVKEEAHVTNQYEAIRGKRAVERGIIFGANESAFHKSQPGPSKPWPNDSLSEEQQWHPQKELCFPRRFYLSLRIPWVKLWTWQRRPPAKEPCRDKTRGLPDHRRSIRSCMDSTDPASANSFR